MCAKEILAIDIETHEDKDISKYGPGSHRHYLDGEDSYILGIAMSDGKDDWYFPASPSMLSWLRDIQNDYLFVGHNILYDLSWLNYEGFRPQHVADTMGLVKLLHEDRPPRKGFARPYSLDACANDYLGSGRREPTSSRNGARSMGCVERHRPTLPRCQRVWWPSTRRWTRGSPMTCTSV
jgi:hypothetical protein